MSFHFYSHILQQYISANYSTCNISRNRFSAF